MNIKSTNCTIPILSLCFLLSPLLIKAQGFTHTPLTLPVENKTTTAVLTLPEGEGPFPATVIIAGSGATDKDGNTSGLPGKNNALKMLAEALAKKGYASLRYDKRIFAGFGEQNLMFEDFVTDAVSAFKLLEAQPKTSKVGLIGHSQGSLVAMLAAQQVEAAFCISIAGPSSAFDEMISKQLRANPANPKPLIEQAESIMAELKQGREAKDVPPPLMPLFRPGVQRFIGSWMKYNPAEEVAKLNTRCLFINGTHDIQVGVENMNQLYNAAPSPSFRLKIAGMNHVLKDAPEEQMANLATYTNPNLPLSAGLVTGIASFIASALKP